MCRRAPVMRASKVGVERHGFGGDRDARQAQPRRYLAVVGVAHLRQEGRQRLQPDAEAEGGGVLQRAHQHGVVDQRHVGLREGDAAGLDQFGHLGQALALKADGECADRVDVGAVQLLGAIGQHLDQAGLVEHGVGVGRDRQAGDAAGHRRLHLGLERGAVFVAGLAQARGEVDETGGDDQPAGVDRARGLEAVRRLAEGDDLAAGDIDVAHRIDAVGRIDDAAVGDQDVHQW